MKQNRCGLSACVLVVALVSAPASALEFEVGDLYGNLSGFFTLGAAWRVEDRDPDLIGKLNLQPGLCTLTNRTDNPNAATLEYAAAEEYEARGLIGGTCNNTTDPSLNLAYVNAPGSYNINGDDGNLNFDRGDVVSAAAKLNSRLTMNWGRFAFDARGIWQFNDTYVDFENSHPDTTLQPARTPLSQQAQRDFGTHFELTNATVSTFFTIPYINHDVSLRVGRQAFVWGESNALPLNSINTVNPPDQARQRLPGFDLDELFRPVGMAFLSTDLTLNLAMEAFYQYEWLPARIDAPGTFFSVSDILGGSSSGGQYAMLSFGKAPEDPQSLYSSQDNPEDPFALGSGSSRTIYRIADNKPKDTGQFGIGFKYFAESFNNGTEFGFYYHHTHSRLPLVSFIAADETCANDATSVVGLAVGCGALLGDIGTLRLADEPLPVDTVQIQVEYPENRHLFGVSFNTTVGNFAWAGEYSFRPNHPVQVHTVDLLFAALQPAFPANNINIGQFTVDPVLGLIPLPQVPGVPGTVLPGRRLAVPDYIQTIHRGQEVTPGMHIRGYEELKQGQFVTSLLRTFGAAENPIRADQILMLMEFGLTHIIDMPSLNRVQFQGAETNTHISNGADGTINGVADSAALSGGFETDGDGDPRCVRQSFESIGGAEAEPCRQNPTAEDPDRFGDELSYGVRVLTSTTYNDIYRGWNFEPVVALFHDIQGVAPGLGQNFQEGRTTALLALRFNYLSRWFTDLRYTYQDGKWDATKDRDTLSFTLQYNF